MPVQEGVDGGVVEAQQSAHRRNAPLGLQAQKEEDGGPVLRPDRHEVKAVVGSREFAILGKGEIGRASGLRQFPRRPSRIRRP